VDWLGVVQEGVKWQVVLKVIMNIWCHERREDFVPSRLTISY
jgi:hypothetical protein